VTVHAGRVVARLLLIAAMLGGMAVEAGAQMAVPGGTGVTGMQSPAVFGGARRQQPGTDSVTVSTSGFAGYDTNILIADTGGTGPGGGGSSDQTASTFAGAAVNLGWSKQSRRVAYFGAAGADYRSYFDLTDFNVGSYSGAAGIQAQLTPRSSFTLGGDAAVQPFYQFGLLGALPAGGVAPLVAGTAGFTPDLQGAREKVLRYGFYGSYQYRITQKTAFSADAGRSGFEPLNETATATTTPPVNLGNTSVAARITHRLTTNLGARVGYGYTQFDSVPATGPGQVASVDQSFALHNIDVGIDYARAFTVARRTSFSFGTGTNVTRSKFAETAGGDRTNLNFVGFASLQRQFLRTWASSLSYSRSTTYVEAFNEFGIFDSVTAAVGGLFRDRLDGSAGVQFFTGTVGAADERLGTLNAGGQLRYAISTNVATFVSYTYSRFDVPENREPVVTGTYKPQRQGVRAGVTIWFDLLH